MKFSTLILLTITLTLLSSINLKSTDPDKLVEQEKKRQRAKPKPTLVDPNAHTRSNLDSPLEYKKVDNQVPLTLDHIDLVNSFGFHLCNELGKVATAGLLKAYWEGVNIPEITKVLKGGDDLRLKYTWDTVAKQLKKHIGVEVPLREEFRTYLTEDANLYLTNTPYLLEFRNIQPKKLDAKSDPKVNFAELIDKSNKLTKNIGGTISQVARVLIASFNERLPTIGALKKSELDSNDNYKCLVEEEKTNQKQVYTWSNLTEKKEEVPSFRRFPVGLAVNQNLKKSKNKK